MSTSAFDSVAATYDRSFTETSIGRLQREAVWRYLERHVLGTGLLSILELGAGTGEDAVRFAALGHRVLATDASPAMVSVAASKARAAGRPTVEFDVLDIGNLDARDPRGPFDLVFSNFAGLNCLAPDSVRHFAHTLDRLLAPEGRAVLVLLSSACAWESLWLALRGDLRQALRRRSRHEVSARVGEATVPIWYHRRSDLDRMFRPWFTIHRVRPVGCAVPPSHLERILQPRPRLLHALAAVDRRLERLPVFARISDHVIYDLVRAPSRSKRRGSGPRGS